MTRIERFGWRGPVEPGIARITSAHGDYYHVVCNEAEGEIIARKKKGAFAKRIASVRDAAGGLRKVERGEVGDEILKPITGDFVRIRHNEQGESMLTEILPRFSSFERRDPTARRKSQVLAVNFDFLFLMMSLTENFSIPRLERYLALAECVGEARVVAVLTKRDLLDAEAVASRLAEVRALGCEAAAISAKTGEGMDFVRALETPRRTFALIGSSGVGKSTLLNALAGEEWAATQEVQGWSGKGRHTTTSRELAMLPSGAMVLDTPGVREIGMVGETDAALPKGASTHRWRF